MNLSDRPELFVFRLGRERFALPLPRVLGAVRAAHAGALPGAPELVLGLLNLRGEVMPVIDLGRRFGQPGRDISPNDIFLIARSARRTMALRIDAVDGLAKSAKDADNLPAAPGVEGVALLPDGMGLICDLDACLSLDDEERLAAALAARDDADA